MDAKQLIYDRFLKPFEGKTANHVGVELEFPLLSDTGGDVDRAFAQGVFAHFLARGWHTALTGTGGEPLFIENEAGDVLSFDNSYNNFEFAMQHGDDLCAIEARFRAEFQEVQDYFATRGYFLAGRGTNPNKHRITQNSVPFATYGVVNAYLHQFPARHPYPDFPAYLSSVQTHLDVEQSQLAEAYALFARMDFLHAILFANSPDFEGKGYRCYRDYLWEKSAFGSCPAITGKVDAQPKSVEDLIEQFLDKGLFYRMRDGKAELFAPVPIRDYFSRPDARAEDLECYLSFQSIEITARGTLEVRGDCEQPLDATFAPPAFHLGILNNLEEARFALDAFLHEENIQKTNSELRDWVCEGKPLSGIADEEALSAILSDLVEIAADGLRARGKGEERFLLPLYDRAARLAPPVEMPEE